MKLCGLKGLRISATGIVIGLIVLFCLITLPRVFEILNTRGRVIASYRTPTGVEIFVVQRFTKDGDLFNTSFYARRADGIWAWAYADHEDSFWSSRSASLKVETNQNRIIVLRKGTPYLSYDWDDDSYFLNRFNRTITGTDLWTGNRRLPEWWTDDLTPQDNLANQLNGG